jgi:hypothetical protein
VAAAFVIVTDARERDRVLHAVFARFLTGTCPDIPEVLRARTWVDLDELQARTHARGWFVPGELSRVRGSFTRAGASEVLYTFEVHECVENGGHSYVDVVFDSATHARVALVTTSTFAPRGVAVTRARAGAVDEVSFATGRSPTWVHLANATTWAP